MYYGRSADAQELTLETSFPDAKLYELVLHTVVYQSFTSAKLPMLPTFYTNLLFIFLFYFLLIKVQNNKGNLGNSDFICF